MESELDRLNKLTHSIIGAAMEVHKALGPGLLESAYESCLTWELAAKNLSVERQKALPIIYRGNTLDAGYRIDLLVEQEVIVELKAIEKILPIHNQQLLSYLKLANKKLGLLINFNVEVLHQGVHRVIHGKIQDSSP